MVTTQLQKIQRTAHVLEVRRVDPERARGAGEDWPAVDQFRESRSYWKFGDHLTDFAADANVPPALAPDVTDIVGAHNILIWNGASRGPSSRTTTST